MFGFGKGAEHSHRGWRILASLNDSFAGEGCEAVAMIVGGPGISSVSATGPTEHEALKAAIVKACSAIEVGGYWICSLTCWKCGQGDEGTTVIRAMHVAVPDAEHTKWTTTDENAPCPKCSDTNTVLQPGRYFTSPAFWWAEGEGWKDFAG